MLTNIFNTIMFGLLNFCLYRVINYRKNRITVFFIAIFLVIIIYMINYFENLINSEILIILLFFSFGLIILYIMKLIIDYQMAAKKKEVLSEKTRYFTDIKNIIIKKIFPILAYGYQLLIIWVPELADKMLND